MRLNYETCIIGEDCVLVPYRPEHVPKYHEWMLDPHLLEMTGSEPLSLEEEIEMQQSWRDDTHKCTFIVLDKGQCDFAGNTAAVARGNNDIVMGDDPAFVSRNLHAMVGDVNLFFSEEEEDEDENSTDNNPQTKSSDSPNNHSQQQETQQLQAELDIMIAESSYRGKGLGKEASCLMMWYGSKVKQIRRYFCKIKEANTASLGMFQDKLGFEQCAYAACFQEYELERKQSSSDEMMQAISKLMGESFRWTSFSCSLA